MRKTKEFYVDKSVLYTGSVLFHHLTSLSEGKIEW